LARSRFEKVDQERAKAAEGKLSPSINNQT